LFKLHPDFDYVLGEILRQDPLGRLVLVHGHSLNWSIRLRERFGGVNPDVVERVVFVPRLSTPDFARLMALADVLIDPPHFSGGNTSLEAFSVGAPIVTQPGPLLRSRITAACYRKMGITDCIVTTDDAYVQTALRLANDHSWHEEIRTAILANNHVLYEDLEVVREFECFFERAIDATRSGERLQEQRLFGPGQRLQAAAQS